MTRGGGWGLRAKICHGPRATLIRPWSLSVVFVVLMPIAKDRKRAHAVNSPRRRITPAQ